MAVGDISAFAPIVTTPGTTAAIVATVPANEEWTLRFVRGVCLIATGGTAPAFSVGITSACNELCFNEIINIPSGTAVGAKNAVGPDYVTLSANTPIYARASATSAVRLMITGTRKQVS